MTYRIIKKEYEGVLYWTVERTDGKAFDGAICGYNFTLDNWQSAIACKQDLIAKFGED